MRVWLLAVRIQALTCFPPSRSLSLPSFRSLPLSRLLSLSLFVVCQQEQRLEADRLEQEEASRKRNSVTLTVLHKAQELTIVVQKMVTLRELKVRRSCLPRVSPSSMRLLPDTASAGARLVLCSVRARACMRNLRRVFVCLLMCRSTCGAPCRNWQAFPMTAYACANTSWRRTS